MKQLILSCVCIFSLFAAKAQYMITVAGTSTADYTGDGGPATDATLRNPYSIAFDNHGNMYIADFSNSVIRMVNSSGIISTVAGNGSFGYSGDGGAATSAALNSPTGVAVDASGNLLIADNGNNVIRKVNSSGVISTVAGTGTWGYSGDGGPATAAKLFNPCSVAFDGSGNFFISDNGNNRIRKVNALGIISTFAGNGTSSFSGDGGAATSASLSGPAGIALDLSDNLYIADYSNNRIRKVSPTDIITTVIGTGVAGFSGDGSAGTSAKINGPYGITTDRNGNLFFTDLNNQRVRMVSQFGEISTIAGNGTAGYWGWYYFHYTETILNNPYGISTDSSGNIFIADTYNNLIWQMPGYPASLPPNDPGSAFSFCISFGDAYFYNSVGGGYWTFSNNHLSYTMDQWSGDLWMNSPGIDTVTYTLGSLHTTTIITIDSLPVISSIIPGLPAYLLADTITYRDSVIGGIWYSEDTTIARINPSTGFTTFVGAGTVRIHYALSNSCLIVDSFTSVFITAGTAGVGEIRGLHNVCMGSTILLTDSTIGGSWSARNGHATIDSTGLVTGISTGLDTITYTRGGINVFLTLTVNPTFPVLPPITGPSSVVVGSFITLSIADSGGYWFSSDANISSSPYVYPPYTVRGLSVGTNTITYYRTNACSYSLTTFPITVTPDIVTSPCVNIINTIMGGQDGNGDSALHVGISNAIGVVTDAVGNVYLTTGQSNDYRILKVSPAGIITTFAGNGIQGYAGDGGPATAAELNFPMGMAIDSAGNLFVADEGNCRIRKINTSGIISTVAGIGIPGYFGDGGQATAATLGYPSGIAFDKSGNLFIADIENARIRKVDVTGIITTYAGIGSWGYNGDNRPASTAELVYPADVTFDKWGNLIIADDTRVRKIDTNGIITTIAGGFDANYTGDGGPATAATLGVYVWGVATDTTGNIFVADYTNNVVRKISISGIITTVAGNGIGAGSLYWGTYSGDGGPATSAGFFFPSSISIENNGDLVIADYSNGRIRKVNSLGIVNTIAGNGTRNYFRDNLPDSNAALQAPSGLAKDKSGNLYIADSRNGKIRKINRAGLMSTYAVIGTLDYTESIAIDTLGNLFFVDNSHNVISKIDTFGIITTVAGTGAWGFSGDGGPATLAKLYSPSGVAVDKFGNLFIADTRNHKIRKVNSAGIISTIAGTDSSGYSGDGGPATDARIYPGCLVADSLGNIFLGDWLRVRKIDTAGIISTVVGNGTYHYAGDGSVATATGLNPLWTLTLDAGNLYIGTYANVYKVTPAGIIYDIAGVPAGFSGYSGDGGPATDAQLNGAGGIIIDSVGNVIFSDVQNNRIRRVNNSPIIQPITGTNNVCMGGSITLHDTTVGGMWSSSDTAIAAVDSSGVVTGVTAGVDTIRYNVSGTCGYASIYKVITVDLFPTAGTISGTNSVSGAASSTLTDSISGGIWTSSNPAVAIVGALSGVVTGASVGSVIISYTITNGCGSVTATMPFTVNPGAFRLSCPGYITTLAGNGTFGFSGDGGAAVGAKLFNPSGVALDLFGNVYIADAENNRVRMVDPSGTITTLAGTGSAGYNGDGGAATAAKLNLPSALVVDSTGVIYIADRLNQRIRKVDLSGTISTVGGTGIAGYSGDGGAATAAKINAPLALAMDGSGNLFFVDNGNNRIRKISTSGVISTVCGNGSTGYSGDGGIATAAGLNNPSGIALDGNGNLYIADQNNNRIRKVNPTGIINTIAGTGTSGYSGDSGDAMLAKLNAPAGITIDVNGSLFVSDKGNNVLRKIEPSGIINTFAGNGSAGFSGDGSPATAAQLNSPCGITVNGSGNLYVADLSNNRIRKLTYSSVYLAGITGSNNICMGSTNTLSDITPSGVWSSGNAAIATIDGSGHVTPVSVGTDTISYTKTISCGSLSVIKIISVNSTPIVGGITGLSSVCVGATDTLTDSISGGAWSASNGKAVITDAGAITGFAAGIDTIHYIVSNICGSANTTKIVTVNPLPVYGSITGVMHLCLGATSTLTESVTGGVWSALNSDLSISGSGVITGLSVGTDTVSYTVSNTCGSASAVRIISVDTLLNVGAISGADSICTGSSFLATDATTGGSWSSASSAIASVSGTGLVTGVSAGITNISYTVSNSCGAVSSVHAVKVNPAPNSGTISGSSIICMGIVLTLSESATGGIWSSSSTGVATVTSGGVVSGVSNGTAQISYSVTNVCGTVWSIKTLTVNTAPVVSAIVGIDSVCTGATVTLSESTTGGTWSAANSHAIVVSGVVSAMTAGIDTIRYSKINACGSDAVSFVITVNPSADAGTITGSSSVCVGSVITLTNTATDGTWSITNHHATDSFGVVTCLSEGVDTVNYTVITNCGMATATKIITMNPLPDAGIITGTATVCVNATTTLADVVTGGVWSLSNGFATDTAGVVRGMAAGTDTITYTYSNGCGDAYTVMTITVNPLPYAGYILGNNIICVSTATTFTDSAGFGSGSWTLTNGNATVSATGIVTGVTTGIDSIVYTASNSCGTTHSTKAITVSTIPSTGIISGSDTVCVGLTSSLSESVTGGIWSIKNTNASITSAVITGIHRGLDTVIYTVSNTCGSHDTTMRIYVDSNLAPAISGIALLCIGSYDTLTGSPMGGLWSLSNSHAANVGNILLGISGGNDTVNYTVTNHCGSSTATLAVRVFTIHECDSLLFGGNTRLNEEGIRIYPNPTTGAFTIEISSSVGAATYSVMDVYGKLIAEETIERNSNNTIYRKQIDLSEYAKGTYMIRVVSDSKVYVEKMVVW